MAPQGLDGRGVLLALAEDAPHLPLAGDAGRIHVHQQRRFREDGVVDSRAADPVAAAGNPVARGPPNRSQRAVPLQWAPTAARDAKPLFGIGNCPRLGEVQVLDGFDDDGHHEIDMRYAIEGGELVTEIVDDGLPFNMLEKEDPDLSLSIEDKPIGGLGVYLVKQLTDSQHYERRDDKNHLVLRKRIDQEA